MEGKSVNDYEVELFSLSHEQSPTGLGPCLFCALFARFYRKPCVADSVFGRTRSVVELYVTSRGDRPGVTEKRGIRGLRFQLKASLLGIIISQPFHKSSKCEHFFSTAKNGRVGLSPKTLFSKYVCANKKQK